MKPLILALGILCLPAAARAQVIVHQAALDQLAGMSVPSPASSMAVPPPIRPRHRHILAAAARSPGAGAAAGAGAAVRRAAAPVVTAAARVPAPAPAAAAAPAATPKAAPPAAPRPVAPPAPLTIRFAPGSADLPPGTGAALQPFCKTTVPLGIDARAPGDPSDPSVAMRLSLARALSIRDALAACGVAAKNLLPRARGNIPGANEDAAVLGGPIK